MKAKKLLVVLAGAALPFLGNASVIISYSTGFSTFPPAGTTVSLPLYDGLSGPLLSVTLEIQGVISGAFEAQNNSSQNNTVTLKWDPNTTASDDLAGGPYLMASGGGTVTDSDVLAPFGFTDFGGSKSLAYSGSDTITGPDKSNFIGMGTFDVNIANVVPWTITGTASATGDAFDFFNEGTVTVYYEVPEPQTYALLAGLGMLGFVAFRRFRA